MNTLPRKFELTNCDAENLSSGNARTLRDPNSAFLIPFTFSRQFPLSFSLRFQTFLNIFYLANNPVDAAILHFLSLDDLRHQSCRYVRCAWFFVALFAKVREAMILFHRHNSYLRLAELWREFIWTRREKIYEDIRSMAVSTALK